MNQTWYIISNDVQWSTIFDCSHKETTPQLHNLSHAHMAAVFCNYKPFPFSQLSAYANYEMLLGLRRMCGSWSSLIVLIW